MSIPDQVSEKDKKQLSEPESEPAGQEAKQERVLDLVDKTAAQKKGEDEDTSEQEKNMESEGG